MNRKLVLSLTIAGTLLVLPAMASAELRGTMGVIGGLPTKLTSMSPTHTPLGDIDGDGYADILLVDIPFFADSPPGRARIVFGQAQHANLDLAAPSPRVRELDPPSGTGPGPAVSAAGDVNGDGIDDVLLTFTRGDAWSQAVIFGGPGIRTLTPAQFASRGFEITNGFVVPVGDVNGDGRDDLLASRPNNLTGPRDVTALLVWGKTTRSRVDLSRPGAAALTLGSLSNLASRSTGADVNGDGIGDLVVGADPIAGPDGTKPDQEPDLTVIFGRRAWTPVSLTNPGSRGYRVQGAVGSPVNAGDVTGDGRDDLIIASDRGFSLGLFGGEGPARPAPSIVPGQSGTRTLRVGLSIEDPGDAILLDGTTAPFVNPNSVVPVGDVTGDGRSDLVAMADGSARVVAGRPGPGVVDVRTQPKIPGAPSSWALAAAGDVDGDGRPDVIASTPVPLDGRPVEQSGLTVLITHGLDVLAPQFLGFRNRANPSFEPASFKVGKDATNITLGTSEDATAEIILRRSSGATVGTFRIPVTGESVGGQWDGRINGRALAPGTYRATVTLVDAARNRSAPRSVDFTILP